MPWTANFPYIVQERHMNKPVLIMKQIIKYDLIYLIQ